MDVLYGKCWYFDYTRNCCIYFYSCFIASYQNFILLFYLMTWEGVFLFVFFKCKAADQDFQWLLLGCNGLGGRAKSLSWKRHGCVKVSTMHQSLKNHISYSLYPIHRHINIAEVWTISLLLDICFVKAIGVFKKGCACNMNDGGDIWKRAI